MPTYVRRSMIVAVASLTLIAAMAPAAAHTGPDGLIAFEWSREIYVMDSDGANLVNLSNYAAQDGHPLWSPDGAHLAFTSTRDRVSGASGVDIYVVEVRSRGIHRVTLASSGGPPSSWSPDGASILYVGIDINRVDVATQAVVRLVMGDEDAHPQMSFDSPSYSPDGSRIVYAERSRGYESSGGWPPKPIPVDAGAIFVMDADGSNPKRLTSTPTPEGSLVKWTDNDLFPRWSPDGTQIVFVSDVDGIDDHDLDLYVMNADGGDRRRLTNEEGFVGYPAWSPNGTKIAYSGNENSFVIDTDGRNRVNLGNAVADSPSWSADGTHIALRNVLGMAIVNPDGSELTVVVPEGLEGEPVLATPLWQPVFPTVGLVDPGTGIWYLRDWDRAATFYYGDPGDSPIIGDWDCNGTATPGLYRQADGYVYLRNSNSQGVADIRFFLGNPSDLPIAGDFNGDGCDTLSVYRPSEQRFYIMNKLGENGGGVGAADFSFQFGNPGDKPVIGDWDGDGIDEVGLHRESTGFFFWRNTLDVGVASGEIFFGDPGDRFVPVDWGIVDGIDTPAIFRPDSLSLYLRHTLTQGIADSQFVWTGAGARWLPVSGTFGLG